MCQPPTGQMVFSNVSNENVHGLNLPSLDTMYQKKNKDPLHYFGKLNYYLQTRKEKKNEM